MDQKFIGGEFDETIIDERICKKLGKLDRLLLAKSKAILFRIPFWAYPKMSFIFSAKLTWTFVTDLESNACDIALFGLDQTLCSQ